MDRVDQGPDRHGSWSVGGIEGDNRCACFGKGNDVLNPRRDADRRFREVAFDKTDDRNRAGSGNRGNVDYALNPKPAGARILGG